MLFRLDLAWRVRRLHFLGHLIDDILLGLGNFHFGAADAELSLEEQEQKEYAEEIVKKSGVTWDIPDEAAKNQYFEALLSIKRQINKAYMELRIRGRKLRARNLAARDVNTLDDDDLKTHVQTIQPLREIKDQLEEVLGDEKRLARHVRRDRDAVALSFLQTRGGRKSHRISVSYHDDCFADVQGCIVRQVFAGCVRNCFEKRAGLLPVFTMTISSISTC